VIGPVAFVASWSLLGLVEHGYSPLHDPISDLAGVHATTRLAMSAGFVVFAIGLCFYAFALHAVLRGPAWTAALATGLATLGVAGFPLHHSSTVDHVHGVFAAIGYITLAATALLSAAPLARRNRHGWARAAVTAGVVSSIALALTLTPSFHGLFQRIGLTAGDLWVAAAALAIRRDGFDQPAEQA
jgi:hypothetical membrane protein